MNLDKIRNKYIRDSLKIAPLMINLPKTDCVGMVTDNVILS